jgi:SAM-dependent methyltransferase
MKHISEFVREHPGLAGYTVLSWDEDAVKAFWDFEAVFDTRYFTNRWGEKIAELFASELSGKQRILDYGAGKGFLTTALLANGYNVSCFDLSEESMKVLDGKFDGKPNYLGSFTPDKLDEQRGQFDAVMLVEVIEHLEDEAREIVLSQVNELLKPGGILIVSCPNEENLMGNLICNPRTREVYHRWQHVYSWSGNSLGKEVERFGFTTIAKRPTNMKYEGGGLLTAIKRTLRRAAASSLEHLFVVAKKK